MGKHEGGSPWFGTGVSKVSPWLLDLWMWRITWPGKGVLRKGIFPTEELAYMPGPGDTVTCWMMVKSFARLFDKLYYGIKYDDRDCGSKYNVRATFGKYEELSCKFRMPEGPTKVTFYGGHARAGRWKEDFSYTVDYTPAAAPKPPVKPPVKPPPKKKVPPVGRCKQWFKVVDKKGTPVPRAFIRVFNKGGWSMVTGGDGRASIDLVEGERYTVIAEEKRRKVAKVYEPGGPTSDTKKFTACTEEIVLKLKVEVPIKLPKLRCTQWVKVVDERGIPIEQATVSIPGVGKRYTAHGKCSISLPKGESYTVEASKKGYECIDCRKKFTACIPPIVLTLKKKEVKCTQWFKVVDEKGEPIHKATVTVKGVGKMFTDVHGRVSTTLTEATFPYIKSYTVTAEKEGYDCLRCTKRFTPCQPEILLTLKKKVCIQFVKVVDEKGNALRDAEVEIVGTPIRRRTGSDGRCRTFLTEGKSYTVKTKKKNYECLDCEKTFIACTKEIVLTLKMTIECTQRVRVVDDKGAPIGGVTVTFKGVGKKFTGADGKTSVSLKTGTSYTVIAEKEDYDCLDCKKTFTACTDEIVLSLKKKVVEVKPPEIKCKQGIKVLDEKKEPVGGATVRIKGIGKKLTGADGKTSVSLIEGTSYTVIAEKEGYDCLDCKRTFTACTEEIVLLIKKKE